MKTHTHIRMVLASLLVSLSLAALTGCQTAHIKTPEWEASLNSHWFKRDVDRLDVKRTADGGYSISLNGYKSDASEQLPQFTRETLAGLVAIGQLFPMAAHTSAPVTTYTPAAPAAAYSAASAATCADGSCDDADPACADGSCAPVVPANQ